jgi:predicted RNA binding protein YcfA (HicA-like mRNA interferase family)
MLRQLNRRYDQSPEPTKRLGYKSVTPGRRVAVGQKGSDIRLQKNTPTETLKLTVPTHRPIKRSTLSHILKQAKLTPEDFDKLL